MKNKQKIYQIIPEKKTKHFSFRYFLFSVFAFALVSSLGFFLARNMQESEAANLKNFDPGNIISDSVMRNYTSMTEAQIQSFLKSKNDCNDRGIDRAKRYPKLTYHIKDGHFVCMADETFDTGNGGKQTAAHIIWQVAQDYKINPQVLIVTLQKEQGLVTDTWPNSRQYDTATGFYCPDDGSGCNAKYAGFYNQIRNAASLYNEVLSGGWTNYPLGNNNIKYNPNEACGRKVVNVKNLATSALYRYTPYVPNQSALNAGYGRGDGCGAYGNRNFYLYFTDWFGSTTSVIKTTAQKYYDSHKSQTGNMLGESSCIDVNNKAADLAKQGTYFCNHKFEKGNLHWLTYVGSSGSSYDSNAFFLNGETENFYNSLPKNTIASLGAATGTVKNIKDENNKDAKMLTFEKGSIIKTGNNAKSITDVAYSTWISNQSLLGKMNSQPKTFNDDKNLRIVEAEKGVVLGNNQIGYFAIKTKAFNKWRSNRGALGYPTASWQRNGKTGMEWQNFSNGVLVGNDSKGWFMSFGGSRTVWNRNGFESGPLGFPTSDFYKNNKTGMEWQNYEHGVIVGNNAHGWYISYAGARSVWQRKGFESGPLGWPTSDVLSNSKTGMQWQNFTGGVAVGNNKYGWFESRGGARSVWKRKGFESGALGWPTSDIQRNNKTGMEWQNFTGGVAVGNDQHDWYESRGSIRTKWQRSGFESGRYGWPTSDIQGNRQNYQHGWIYE